MTTDTDRLVVITGGPGAGKTTLLQALARRDLATSPEGGRAIIRHQQAIGGEGLPWRDRMLFAALMLSWDMRSHEEALARPGPTLFDRGIVDVAGYLALSGLPVPAPVEAAAAQLRYRRHVFVAPPWPDIFTQDDERKQDFAEAERTHHALVAAYRRHSYALVDLPLAAPEARAEFVLSHLAR